MDPNNNSNSKYPFGEITEKIIGAAIEVHKILGPGLPEEVYEQAFCHELGLRKIKFERQKENLIHYKDICAGKNRLDVLVEDTVIIELKSVDTFHPIHEAQLMTYLRTANKKIGLLINFNVLLLKDGIKRIIL